MEFTIIKSDKTCGGIVGTEPNHNNWTLTPYLGGFVKEFWNGTQWIEGATTEEIAAAIPPSLTVNEVIIDLVTKQVETMTEEEKTGILQTLLTQ
jgi:hypothetical protein